MALIDLPPFPLPLHGHYLTRSPTQQAIDAAGESRFTIGRLYIQGGSGTKTLSAAGGGKVYADLGTSNTFANGTTKLRFGVQDVASGQEDGTFDTYAELTGGVDTIASTINAMTEFALTSGSKTMTHGDLIAIGAEMTARGGADSVRLNLVESDYLPASQYPYRSDDTGSGPTIATGSYMFAVKFDDGTLGWIFGLPPTGTVVQTNTAFHVNSNPDEYVSAFTPTFRFKTCGAIVGVSGQASGEDAEVILYSDVFGTPAAQKTITHNSPDRANSGSRIVVYWDPVTHEVGTTYGVAVRPTTTGALSVLYYDLAANANLKVAVPFGTSTKYANRINLSGAFSEVTNLLPHGSLFICAIDDGAGGGSGGAIFSRIRTGM